MAKTLFFRYLLCTKQPGLRLAKDKKKSNTHYAKSFVLHTFNTTYLKFEIREMMHNRSLCKEGDSSGHVRDQIYHERYREDNRFFSSRAAPK